MKRKGDNQELVPVAGRGRPKLQRVSKSGWTREKEQMFLSALAETCNVTQACKTVGMSKEGAYVRRRKNAAFRAAWIETISAAYQRLELVLLERTLNGTEKVFRRHDGSEDRMREYPNGLGLSLLKLHRAGIEETTRETPEAEIDEVRERVVRKLLRLKKRLQG